MGRRTAGTVAVFAGIVGVTLPLGAFESAWGAEAPDTALQAEIEILRGEIQRQQNSLDAQQEQLRRLEQRLFERIGGAGGQIVDPGLLEDVRGAGTGAGGGQANGGVSDPVGEAAPETRPEVSVLSDVGGVLTPRGRLVVDPSFEFSHTAVNKFFFSGVQIVDAVLIGAIEATDARRDSFTPSIGARYGVTNRIEVDARVPYSIRDDVESDPLDASSPLSRELSANDLGDVEFGAHYQINDGTAGWPYFIGNLRFKTTTGTGPFDVAFDSQGRQRELPTGSGFYTLEPSVTVLYPTDPVVLFGNIGYAVNLPDDVDKTIGSQFFGKVDPGDNLRTSFGIGFGINQQVSMSLGYEHSYVFETDSEIDGVTVKSDPAQVGSFLFGLSLAVTDRISTNLNVAVGATEDAPDVRIGISTPISIDLFN